MASKSVLTTTVNFGMVSAPVGVKKLSDDPKKATALSLASPSGNAVKQTYAEGDALYLITLMYAGDCAARVAEAQQALAGFTADEKTLGLARTLVQAQMLDREAIDAYADESRERKSELIMAAAQGEAIEVPEHAEASAPMVDLEAALVASIGQTASKKKKPAAKMTAAAA